MEETLEDQYPEERWPPQDQGRLRTSFHYLLRQPENRLRDDVRAPETRETRDEILTRASRKGYRAGKERLGEKVSAWRWGDVHGITFRNQTLGKSGIAPIERIFNRGPFPMHGDASVVNVAGWDAEEPFEVNHIVSMRVIVDMSDPESSVVMQAPGKASPQP